MILCYGILDTNCIYMDETLSHKGDILLYRYVKQCRVTVMCTYFLLNVYVHVCGDTPRQQHLYHSKTKLC